MPISMREAIRTAIRDEMLSDRRVVVFGEDVARAGGVFKVTAGLLEEFGDARVRDTPISETAIIGAAVGAAAAGLRPVVEIMFAEFFGVAMDQVVTELAKMRYLSHGRLSMPVVIRASAGAGLGFGAQHSQTVESWFMNTPGLIVASPSGPRAAYSITRAAIRSDDPVVLIEPRALYGLKEEFDPSDVAEGSLGVAEILRRGTDVTLVALGQMVQRAVAAADRLAPSISCDVIDLLTVRPWDRATVLDSARRTGLVVTVEENPYTGGWGTDLISAIACETADALRAPAVRITCPDAPVPSGPLEDPYLPSVDDVVSTVRLLVEERRIVPPRWTGWRASGGTAPNDDDAALARRRDLADPVSRYERLVEIRAFEDAVAELFAKGEISGATHTCQGQEAVAVGLAAATRPRDVVTCTYRGHGVALAVGADPTTLLAEILGRRSGAVGGKAGSMHLTATNVGLLPTFAIVGAGIPVAVGAALAAQVRGEDGIALAVFGDGATNIGAFHEGLNLAAVWRSPVIFICENNLYGEYSPLSLTTSVSDIAARACAYGIPAEIVDGMDVEAVRTSVVAAAERARSGGGPTLLEMKTYRFSGHSRGDPAKYRSPDEVAAWRARDPLQIAELRLRRGGVGSDPIAAAHAAATERIAAAVATALSSQRPEAGDILTNVWSRS